jgi:hypothetical protein
VSFNDYQTADANRKAKASGSGGGASTWTPQGTPTPGTPPPTAPKQTFEQFIAAEEEKLGQSLGEAKRAELKKQFDAAQQVTPTPEAVNTDLSQYGYGYTVQQVIKGLIPAEKVLTGGTEASRDLAQQQLEDAEKRGLIERRLSEQQLKLVDQISADVRGDKDIIAFTETRDGYDRVQTGADLNNSVGDLSLIFGYMKMLDPASVVRETEFSNAENAIGFAQKTLNFPKKLISGDRLTTEGRQYFANAARRLYESKKKSYDTAYKQYEDRAKRSNIDPALVLRDYGSANATGAGAGPAGGAGDILSRYGVSQ